ncbi:class I SAM-dependent methyltransferase [Pedobacter sp. NJ-S-72]
MNKKPNYGIDAPKVIRNLLLIGLALLILPLVFPVIKIGSALIITSYFMWSGGYFMLSGLLMLLYSLYGKYFHRNRMLNLIRWSGHEMVLDVGTGKGLLMIGAAKRLTTGKSIGIDIWNAEDLTGNDVEAVLKNVSIEGVEDNTEIKTENVLQMTFADDTFDVVISNLCLHNIYNQEGRKKACEEIARVLKPGGIGIISDFRHVKHYKKHFSHLGLQTKLIYSSYFASFPPLTILKIEKPVKIYN